MAVMERGRWTDERIDDLKASVDKGFVEVKEEFGRVKEEFGRVRGEIRGVQGEVRDLRAEMNERFNSVDARFDAMQRTMVIGFASIVASVVGAVGAGLALG
jgi:peptidoglycan hydrolase CwlO-like protein